MIGGRRGGDCNGDGRGVAEAAPAGMKVVMTGLLVVCVRV